MKLKLFKHSLGWKNDECTKRLNSIVNTESKKDLLWIWWGRENDVLRKRDGEPEDKSMEDRGAETGQLEIPLHKKRADILTEILPANLRHIQNTYYYSQNDDRWFLRVFFLQIRYKYTYIKLWYTIFSLRKRIN